MYKNLQHEIENHKVITFDVFDTLLKRIYSGPEDLFSAVGEQVSEAVDFLKHRKDAEQKARKSCQYKEVNLDEIYEFLKPIYGAKLAERLKAAEIHTEIESALPNRYMVKIFNICKAAGKKIFIISDMYLPGYVIAKMLNHIGIKGYDKLYVSNEYRKTKSENGELFSIVLKENGLQASDVLHIGDSKRADVDMPRKRGLSVWQVKAVKNVRYDNDHYLNGADVRSFHRLENFINATMPGHKSLAFRDGYEIFGPILWAYTSWLKEKVEEHRIDKILFFARDGYVLQKAYQILDPKQPSAYFYASRRAVVVPQLSFAGTLNDLLHVYKSWPRYITISHLLSRVGLEKTPQVLSLLDNHNLKPDDEIPFSSIETNEQIVSLFQDLQPLISKNAGEQYNLFRKYFDQTATGHRIAMVDIGGRCTIEDALRTLMNHASSRTELFGLYVLLDVEKNGHRESWLDNQDPLSPLNLVLRFCYYFLEILLSAPHGSVYGYKEDGESIIPEYGPYDYDGAAGEKDADIIRDMQEGALAFIRSLSSYTGYGIHMNQSVVFTAFRNFGIFPEKDDLSMWGDFRFNADGLEPLAHPGTITDYLIHPKQFVKDARNSYWMAGFFCRLFHGRWCNEVFFPVYRKLKKLYLAKSRH